MYGSQFHAQQALSFVRPSTQRLTIKTFHKPAIKMSKLKMISSLILISLALSLSNLSYAGPSEPQIKGGNGNANGR